jgi:hypothetical protein
MWVRGLVRPGARGAQRLAQRRTLFGKAWQQAQAHILHQFEDNFTPDEEKKMRAKSAALMEDPIIEVSKEEVDQYNIPMLPSPPLPSSLAQVPDYALTRAGSLWSMVPYVWQCDCAERLFDLIVERLDNEPLMSAFHVEHGFNMQCYFMMLHVWVLHKRLITEGRAGKFIDKKMFELCWHLVQQWMLLKKIPEFRWNQELKNVQQHMLGMCVALDRALERPDILPARIQRVLANNLYSGEVNPDAECVTLLTKYTLRQLQHVLQVDQKHFLSGTFVWTDFPITHEQLELVENEMKAWNRLAP